MKIKDIENLLSLAAIQGANALFPLFVFPYLFRTVGSEEFSRIVTVEVVSFYILNLVLYSFDVSGIKKIVKAKEESKDALFEEYSVILYSRLLLYLIAASTCLVICYISFADMFMLMVAWLFFPLGMILQSNYYFQATEKNRLFSVNIVFWRLVACLLIYLCVNSERDSFVSVIFISMSYFFSGFFSFLYIVTSGNIKLVVPRFVKIYTCLSEGRTIFFGNFSILLFRGSNVLILSIVTHSPVAVSLYALAEKYIRMVQALARPLNQHYFPKVVEDLFAIEDRIKAKKIIWKNTKTQIKVISIVILIFNSLVFIDALYLKIFFDLKIAFLIFILSGAPFFGVINYMFGVVGLTTLGAVNFYAKSIVVVGFLSVVACFILSFFASETGAAITYLLSEVLLCALFLSYYNRGKGWRLT